MHINYASLVVEASGSIGASVLSGDSAPAWRNILPVFSRQINTAATDAAYAARLTVLGTVDTWTIDNFPSVERNGSPLINDDGQVLIMVQMSLLVIRIGRIDTAEDIAGSVAVTVTDIFGTHSRTLKDGDMVLQERPACPLISTSAIQIAFSEDAENLCADILLLGAKTALPDS